MAVEDFTTYTVVEPWTKFTITATRVTWVTLRTVVHSYVYYDKGANHFDGDFEHLIDVELRCGMDAWGYVAVWMLGDTVGHIQAQTNALYVRVHRGSAYYIILMDGTSSDSYTCSCDTTYYLKVKRVEGSPSMLYCYIYSNSIRTTLVDTLSISLSSDIDFRYVFVCASYYKDTGDSNDAWSQNLDLQEPDVGFAHSVGVIMG